MQGSAGLVCCVHWHPRRDGPGPNHDSGLSFLQPNFWGLILGLTISVAVPCSNAVLMAFCAMLEPRPRATAYQKDEMSEGRKLRHQSSFGPV